jgi:hypothetical protein
MLSIQLPLAKVVHLETGDSKSLSLQTKPQKARSLERKLRRIGISGVIIPRPVLRPERQPVKPRLEGKRM